MSILTDQLDQFDKLEEIVSERVFEAEQRLWDELESSMKAAGIYTGSSVCRSTMTIYLKQLSARIAEMKEKLTEAEMNLGQIKKIVYPLRYITEREQARL